mmetsp:Transcript_19161/g.39092  ORF Transcript_19161/g.39092 Transcript_19161/m.39092 type:complete len:100 (-) Transcript_19161:1392-1691(-)
MKRKKIFYKIKSKEIVFTFFNENHTLGNILRYVIQGNPLVDFVGYNVPHPSENILNVKISSSFASEKFNIMILGIKNCGELLILIGNKFNKKIEEKTRR